MPSFLWYATHRPSRHAAWAVCFSILLAAVPAHAGSTVPAAAPDAGQRAATRIDYPGIGVQVTRLSGHGPALLVVPDGHTPFEA